jgi:hypothetical protein
MPPAQQAHSKLSAWYDQSSDSSLELEDRGSRRENATQETVPAIGSQVSVGEKRPDWLWRGRPGRGYIVGLNWTVSCPSMLLGEQV